VGRFPGASRFLESSSSRKPLSLVRATAISSIRSFNKAIILSCSDSRVGPDLVFDQTLGDVFVVRTAGNVADAVALGSIEYAVDHIHSPLVAVFGHQKCGAVNAACSGERCRVKI